MAHLQTPRRPTAGTESTTEDSTDDLTPLEREVLAEYAALRDNLDRVRY